MSLTSLSRRTLALALSVSPKIGGRTITRVLARMDLLGHSPAEFAKLSPEALQEVYGLRPAAAAAWSSKRKASLNSATELEERMDALGVDLATIADARYPAMLEEVLQDPPGVVFMYGNARLLEARTFCVLSSRDSPAPALEKIEQVTEDCVLEGLTLVSGHDRPEYQRSAVVPLRWGAPRIIVLDRGMFDALGDELDEEPFRAARLWRFKFDPSTDLVLSGVHPTGHFHANSNRERDSLIAGLSRLMICIFLRAGGNMHTLAKRALLAGREVRTWEGSPSSDELLAAGAGKLDDRRSV